WVVLIAVPAGLALAFLAVSMMPRPDRPVSPAAALSSGPSPAVAHPIAPTPPIERSEAQLDQMQVPSASRGAKITAERLETPVMKGRSQHKLSRNARKIHAS